MPSKDDPPKTPAARRRWREDYAGAASSEDKAAQTAAVYAAHVDPWHLSREQARFAATNAIAEARFGKVESLLEIGCGEGYQTVWLARICERLVGADISADALGRARALVPSATFVLTGLPALRLPSPLAAFDLAVACEVLYYADDIGAAIRRMREIAPRGLVTALASKWRRFGPAVEGLPNLAHDQIEADGQVWRVVTWSEPSCVKA
jgi:SAM-dependent methyltransferase